MSVESYPGQYKANPPKRQKISQKQPIEPPVRSGTEPIDLDTPTPNKETKSRPGEMLASDKLATCPEPATPDPPTKSKMDNKSAEPVAQSKSPPPLCPTTAAAVPPITMSPEPAPRTTGGGSAASEASTHIDTDDVDRTAGAKRAKFHRELPGMPEGIKKAWSKVTELPGIQSD